MTNQDNPEPNLTKLGIDELDKRYSKLMHRYAIAKRLGMDQGVIYQLEVLLDAIEFERIRRIESIIDDPNPVVLDTDKLESSND